MIIDLSWVSEAACRDEDPSVFFPADSVGVTAARRICAPCPVREQCLDYAMAMRISHGVWGGTSERERIRIGRSRHRRE